MNEVENTMRILRDEIPLRTSKWCTIGIHIWTKWTDPYVHREKYDSVEYRIEKRCASCNKIKHKSIFENK